MSFWQAPPYRAPGAFDPSAGHENALAPERRVLAETDAAKQVLVGHRVFPESNAA